MREKKKEEGEINEPSEMRDQKGSPLEEYLLWWNDLAEKEGLPKIRRIDDRRRRQLERRLAEYGDFRTEAAEQIVNRNEFARLSSWLNFDFVISKSGLLKLLEGNYRRKQTSEDARLRAQRRRDAEGRAYRAEEAAKAAAQPNLKEALEKLKKRKEG